MFPHLDFRPLIIAVAIVGWVIIEFVLWLISHIKIIF